MKKAKRIIITPEVKASVLYPFTFGKTKWALISETYYDESDPKESIGHGIKKEGFKFIVNPKTTSNCLRYGSFSSGKYWFEHLTTIAKPILKPLSAISDVDAVKVAKAGLPNKINDYLWSSNTGKEFAQYISEGKSWSFYYKTAHWISIYQKLKDLGYDVPLLALGNKTLEQAGLAIYK